MKLKTVTVVAGIICRSNGDVLLTQRLPGKHLAGFWEFPGGKVNNCEPLEEALTRELKEELNLDVRIEKFLGSFLHNYEWGIVKLEVFIVSPIGEPYKTTEIQDFKWAKLQDISPQELAPADLAPLKKYSSFFYPHSKTKD